MCKWDLWMQNVPNGNTPYLQKLTYIAKFKKKKKLRSHEVFQAIRLSKIFKPAMTQPFLHLEVTWRHFAWYIMQWSAILQNLVSIRYQYWAGFKNQEVGFTSWKDHNVLDCNVVTSNRLLKLQFSSVLYSKIKWNRSEHEWKTLHMMFLWVVHVRLSCSSCHQSTFSLSASFSRVLI